MENQEWTVEQLRKENEELRNKLRSVDAEKEAYRKELQKLLPVRDLSDEEEAELQDILVHPERHQTFDQFLRQLESEHADHGR